jgi:hypothetical protein
MLLLTVSLSTHMAMVEVRAIFKLEDYKIDLYTSKSETNSKCGKKVCVIYLIHLISNMTHLFQSLLPHVKKYDLELVLFALLTYHMVYTVR